MLLRKYSNGGYDNYLSNVIIFRNTNDLTKKFFIIQLHSYNIAYNIAKLHKIIS